MQCLAICSNGVIRQRICMRKGGGGPSAYKAKGWEGEVNMPLDIMMVIISSRISWRVLWVPETEVGREPKVRELRREPEGVLEALAVAVAVLEVILMDDIVVCCCVVLRW